MSCSTLEIHQTMIALSLFCVIRELRAPMRSNMNLAPKEALLRHKLEDSEQSIRELRQLVN